MKIEICSTAGLCFGAKRAVNLVLDALKEREHVCIYKTILHNENVISLLQQQGANIYNDLKDIRQNDYIILRAHGEHKDTIEYLKKNNFQFFDSICPNVKLVRDIALQKQKQGYSIIVLGNYKNGKLHDETTALLSYLTNPIVISNVQDINAVEFTDKKYFLVEQTTFSYQEFIKIKTLLEKLLKSKQIEFDYKDTICKMPLNNIKNSKILAKNCNLAIVFGSKSSSNTTELYNCIKNIVPTIFSIDKNEIIAQLKSFIYNGNIKNEDLKIALLAGASTIQTDLYTLKQDIEMEFN